MILIESHEEAPEDSPVDAPPAELTQVTETVETPLKLRALQLFSQTGSLATVSRDLSIPLYELHQLSRTDWWNRELTLLRREEAALENSRLTTIWNRTLEEIEYLLENGEEVYVDGHKRSKRPNGATLARLADVVFNKRQLLRDAPTVNVGSNKKLDELADKLSQLGSARKETLVIDQDG